MGLPTSTELYHSAGIDSRRWSRTLLVGSAADSAAALSTTCRLLLEERLQLSAFGRRIIRRVSLVLP